MTWRSVIFDILVLLLAGSAWTTSPVRTNGSEQLRVMTFNLWVGGESGGQPLAQNAKVIEAAKADMVGVQESHGETARRQAERCRAGDCRTVRLALLPSR